MKKPPNAVRKNERDSKTKKKEIDRESLIRKECESGKQKRKLRKLRRMQLRSKDSETLSSYSLLMT